MKETNERNGQPQFTRCPMCYKPIIENELKKVVWKPAGDPSELKVEEAFGIEELPSPMQNKPEPMLQGPPAPVAPPGDDMPVVAEPDAPAPENIEMVSVEDA